MDPITDGIIAMLGDKIILISHRDDFILSSDANTIDAHGGTILPGIINAHTHGTADPAIHRYSFLLKGVTSVCDMGFALTSIYQFSMDDTSGPSARGFFSGPILTTPRGYPDIVGQGHHLNYEVANQYEARSAVIDLASRGVDYIKLSLEPGSSGLQWPLLNLKEISSIVDEAHAQGKLVHAHVTRATQLDNVLDAGIDVIEHVPLPQFSEAEWENFTAGIDQNILPEDYIEKLMRMIIQGVSMVPTLSAMPAICKTNWYGIPNQFLSRCEDLFLETVQQFHEMGGMIALGNDNGNKGISSGMPIKEMEFLIDAGLSQMEVILSGTSHAARVCGQEPELGSIETNKFADLIIGDGNPLEDIESMTRVLMVIKAGEVVYP